MSLKPFALIAPDACVVTCGYRLHSEIISRSHLLVRQQAQEPRDLSSQLVPPPGHHIVHAPPQPDNPVQRTYTGWQEYFDNLHNRSNPNWGNNPTGPIMENSEPGTSSDYLTPPEGEAEAKTSGVEANTEEAVEDLLQDELSSPVEETEGYSVDPWPEVD